MPTVASPGFLNLSTLFPSGYSAAIAQASKSLEHFFSIASQPASTDGSSTTPQDSLPDLPTTVISFLTGRTALENTSILLAVCTFLVLVMSWTSRFGNLGRFSPFTRSPPQGTARVSDSDFSYITAEDLRKHQSASSDPHHNQARPDSPVDHGPERDTDVLILKNKKREYAVHFPAYSIAKGELTIGQVRDQAAKKTGMPDTRRVKLLYRGRNLKDDVRTCKQEGLRDGAELLCAVADSMPSASASEEEDEDDEFADLDGDQADVNVDGEPKRKRNRGKKSKRRNRREQQISGTSTPADINNNVNLGVPPSQSSTRGPSPSRPPPPTTPVGKLQALYSKLQEYMPQVHSFLTSPPADPAKREFEHKRLSETILAQVLLKLDAVESEGDENARMKRKELVKETQKVLQDLDNAAKA